MKTCYIVAGVSGSGKTTAVRKIILTHPPTISSHEPAIFSLDNCRLDFFDQIFDDPKDAYARAFTYANANERDFNLYVTKCWNSALKNNQTVIVDNTNLTVKSRARWINEARDRGFSITGVQLFAPLDTLLKRQLTRGDKSIPAHVVRDMYFRQQEMMLGSEVDALININSSDETPVLAGGANFA